MPLDYPKASEEFVLETIDEMELRVCKAERKACHGTPYEGRLTTRLEPIKGNPALPSDGVIKVVLLDSTPDGKELTRFPVHIVGGTSARHGGGQTLSDTVLRDEFLEAKISEALADLPTTKNVILENATGIGKSLLRLFGVTSA